MFSVYSFEDAILNSFHVRSLILSISKYLE